MLSDLDDRQSTLGQEIERHCKLRPDNSAVVASGFAPLTYRELQCLINEVRAALRLAGFSSRDRIAIALPNGPQAALAIVGVACSAVSIPLNPKQTLPEIEKSLAALRPDAVLLIKESDSAARRAAEREGIGIIEVAPSREDTLKISIVEPQTSTAAAPDEPGEPDRDAPAFILQTSGTTSKPKWVPYSHSNMLAYAARCQACFDLTPRDRCLSLCSVYSAQGLKRTIFTPLLTGGTVAFPTDAAKFDYSEWFGTLKATWYAAVPTLHRLILDQMRSEADAKAEHSLRFISSAGARLPRNVQEGLQLAFGIPVVESYGCSEASLIAINLPMPGRSKSGTCGIPWPDTVLIVGDDGRQLPLGEKGEILVRGPTVISGYLDAPELNRTRFVNGWFKTGDIGSLDEDGFLTIDGRKDDVINRGGGKVSPSEIDDVLMSHPAVAEAAAFSVPHLRLGEDVVAAVVLRPGMTAAPLELRRYLQKNVALFKVPRRIVIRDQLPKGKTGKVLRRQLAESWKENTATESRITPPPSVELASVNGNLVIQLRELWERLLKTAPVFLDDDFFEKGGDSLLAEVMLIELELLTGRTISSSILLETSTIRQLALRLSEEDGLQAKPLTKLNANGGHAPLFFFHGDYIGGGAYVRRLASLLGSDQPLFVIAPHSVYTPTSRSIEAMATDRLPLIRSAQPQGPYRLAGYCTAGLVAFEAARLLAAAGEKVEMVAMIDSPTINARRSIQILRSIFTRMRPITGAVVQYAMMWTWGLVKTLDNLSAKDMARVLVVAVRKRLLATLRAGGRSPLDQATEPIRQTVFGRITHANAVLVENSLRRANSNYFPGPLAVPVVYFSSSYNGNYFSNNGRTWLRISSDLEVINLPGDHDSMITDPTDLAHHLRARLHQQAAEPTKSDAS